VAVADRRPVIISVSYSVDAPIVLLTGNVE